eukprot:Pgem_evm1s17962
MNFFQLARRYPEIIPVTGLTTFILGMGVFFSYHQGRQLAWTNNLTNYENINKAKVVDTSTWAKAHGHKKIDHYDADGHLDNA